VKRLRNTPKYDSKYDLYLFTFKTKKKIFLHKIVTGNEKWIYYDNPVNHKQWHDPDKPPLFTPKREIHVKKVMLCVWWNQKGIIYYELLAPRQTVNANLYSQQLTRLSEVLQKKRPFCAMVSKRSFCYITTLDHMLLNQLGKG
jgi:hypothetical protein